MKPIRVQLKRTKGWKMPPNTVKVCRPTRWGNPFKASDMVGGELTKMAKAVARFAGMLEENSDYRLEAKRLLRGKNLACFCPLTSPCHADELLRIANE